MKTRYSGQSLSFQKEKGYVRQIKFINDQLSNSQVAIMIFFKSFLPLISSAVRKFHKHRVRQTIKEPITKRNKYRHDCNFSSKAVRNNELEGQTCRFELCQNIKASRTTYLEIMQHLCILDQTAGSSTCEGYQPDCHAELQEWSRMEEIKYISYGCLSVS